MAACTSRMQTRQASLFLDCRHFATLVYSGTQGVVERWPKTTAWRISTAATNKCNGTAVLGDCWFGGINRTWMKSCFASGYVGE
eukprot:scaffold49788_cov64-Cyclotella_meneghiniana.AAC.5